MSKWSSTSLTLNVRWVGLTVGILAAACFALSWPFIDQVATAQESPASQETTNTEAEHVDASQAKSAESDSEVPTIAIINATVHTAEREGALDNATVIYQGHQIIAVGRELAVPEKATVVDAKGGHLTPGLIDVRSRLYLGVGNADQASDGSLDAFDGLDGFDSVRSEVLAAGVTAVYVQPAGSYGGFGATVSTAGVGPSNADDKHFVLKSKSAAQMSLVGSATETSRARKQRYEALQKRLQEALDYQKAWEDYRTALAKWEATPKETEPTPSAGKPDEPPAPENRERPNGGRGRRRPSPPDGVSPPPRVQDDNDINAPLSDRESTNELVSERQEPAPDPNRNRTGPPQDPASSTKTTTDAATSPTANSPPAEPKKPEFDPLKERLLAVLKRELLVRFEVQRAEEIQWALALGNEFQLRLVLEGLGEMKSATPAVLDSQNSVVLGPWLSFSDKPEQRKVVEQWKRAFAEVTSAEANSKGSATNPVVIASFSDSPIGSKWLRYHAAAAVAVGMSREQALRGLTIEAAKVAGVADQVGSIKAGKRADLVLFSGDPLDTRSIVVRVIQHGQTVFDHSDKVSTESPTASFKSNMEGKNRLDRLPLSYALVSQRVLAPDGSWQPAALIIDGNKISAVVAANEVPAGRRVFDLGSQPITPGLKSAWVASPSSATPIAKESDAAQQFAADGFDPELPAVHQMRVSGLTAIHLVNAPTNVIAGQTAWVRLGDLGASSFGQRQAAAEQWSLSAMARNEERYPATLVGQAAMVRNRLAGQLLETTLYLPESAVRKLLLQKVAVLDAVQSGTLPVFIDARTDAEIDAAIRLVSGTQVQAWLCAPNQLRPFVKILAENRIGIVVPATNEQTYAWYFEDLVEAHRAGVRLLIGGQSGEALRLTVAALVNAGLDPAAGRRLLTMDTESTLAKSETVGLTIGADADWLVWSDDPLSLSSELLWHSRGEKP